jgi:hypothetical protein
VLGQDPLGAPPGRIGGHTFAPDRGGGQVVLWLRKRVVGWPRSFDNSSGSGDNLDNAGQQFQTPACGLKSLPARSAPTLCDCLAAIARRSLTLDQG